MNTTYIDVTPCVAQKQDQKTIQIGIVVQKVLQLIFQIIIILCITIWKILKYLTPRVWNIIKTVSKHIWNTYLFIGSKVFKQIIVCHCFTLALLLVAGGWLVSNFELITVHSEKQALASEFSQYKADEAARTESITKLAESIKVKNTPIVSFATATTESKLLGLYVNDSNKLELTNKTQSYIEKYFNWKGRVSPMTGSGIVAIAQSNDFPIDLILANAHLESHGATNGRGAESNNPHNVGNTDAGDGKTTVCGSYTVCLKDWTIGTNAFVSLIRNCYTKGDTASLGEFIDNDFRTVKNHFKDCPNVKIGSRYMTDVKAPAKYASMIKIINAHFID